VNMNDLIEPAPAIVAVPDKVLRVKPDIDGCRDISEADLQELTGYQSRCRAGGSLVTTGVLLHDNHPDYLESLAEFDNGFGDEGTNHKTVSKCKTVSPNEPLGGSVATKLVALAQSIYDLGCSIDKQAFAVPKNRARIARVIGKGDTGLRNELASEYLSQFGTVPSEQAVREAVGIVTHLAMQETPAVLHLRVAPHPDGGIVIDLGDATGEAVIIRPGAWHIAIPPVLFRRTRLTGAFPRPLVDGRLDDLRPLLNVGDGGWTMVCGYLLACLTPNIPRPVGLVNGEHGTGKSDFSRMLAMLIDASPAPVRSLPRDEQNWLVSANASWMIAFDNVSHIQVWLSDAICKASTGDASVGRALYTDSELNIITLQRSILLNTIDAGSLRGDLADRMVSFELERIAPSMRRLESEIREAYDTVWASCLGGLYTLMAQVLEELPKVRLAERPRMADFTNLLAAMDVVRGTNAVQLFQAQAKSLASDVVAGDPVASAVVVLMTNRGLWEGNATDLLSLLVRPEGVEKRHWPATGRALSAALRRTAPALMKVGLNCEEGRRTSKGRSLVLTKLVHYDQAVEIEVVDAAGEGDPF
jgi:hypothetical protein